MVCELCENSLGMFKKPIIGGYICNECKNKFPDFMHIKHYTKEDLVDFLNYQQQDDILKFSETGSYGELLIDEMHGLFRVGNKNSTFRFTNLSAVSINCTNAKVNNGIVYCDVEFNFEIREPELHCKKIVKKHEKCSSKRVNNHQLEWEEPSSLTLFRNIVNGILDREYQNIRRKVESFSTLEDMEILKARSMLMLLEDYTEDELKKNRNALIKTFHPDNGEFDSSYSKKINEAYALLKRQLECRGNNL